MKTFFALFSLLFMVTACGPNTTQVKSSRHVGGPCEGCEAIYESPTAFEKLTPEITLPGYKEGEPKLHISGVVYQKDGKTPAPGVVLYVYHTDVTGVYPKMGDEKGWARRHGYLRGWMKTDDQGRYSFYTVKPAAYPQQQVAPAHIHITVKEPDKNEYYIDDFQFDDDPLLTAEMKSRQRNIGGDGIIKLQKQNGLLVGKRDIVLGKNVQDYE
jgi:protocatechuate 3,4-dioxygenase, beta subunit